MSGLDFPYAIDRSGRTRVVDRRAHVRALVEQVLFTTPGERVNRPEFGAGLHRLVFEPGGDEVATALQFAVQGALQRWLADEIEVRDVDVDADDSRLLVTVSYVLRPEGEAVVDTFTGGP